MPLKNSAAFLAVAALCTFGRAGIRPTTMLTAVYTFDALSA